VAESVILNKYRQHGTILLYIVVNKTTVLRGRFLSMSPTITSCPGDLRGLIVLFLEVLLSVRRPLLDMIIGGELVGSLRCQNHYCFVVEVD
jgi:hypothetical protein